MLRIFVAGLLACAPVWRLMCLVTVIMRLELVNVQTNGHMCRRRKVRCNEIRPICGHCSRLNLECRWRPANSSMLQPGGPGNSPAASAGRPRPGGNGSARTASMPMLPTNSAMQESFDDVFNYASFMWDGSDLWASQNWGQQELQMMDPAGPNTMTVCQPSS